MDRVKLGNIEENKENEKVKRKKNSTIYFKSNKMIGKLAYNNFIYVTKLKKRKIIR